MKKTLLATLAVAAILSLADRAGAADAPKPTPAITVTLTPEEAQAIIIAMAVVGRNCGIDGETFCAAGAYAKAVTGKVQSAGQAAAVPAKK